MTPTERALLRALADRSEAQVDDTDRAEVLRALPALLDALDAAEADAARLREALTEIGNGGRCVTPIRPSPCLGSSKPRKDWCWACIATSALEVKP